MSVTNITPSVTLQPKASAAALDDFNLDGETFADLLRTSMNKEQWFMQTNKKTTQPLAMHKLVGKGNSVSTSIKAVTKESPKSWHIFVGRLHPDTTAEDLTTHLSDRGILVSDCNQLARKEPWQKYAAFRVVIGYEFKDRVFDDADLWPLGMDVRDWYFTSRLHYGDS